MVTNIPDYDISLSTYSIKDGKMNWSFEPEQLGLLRAQIQAVNNSITRLNREILNTNIPEWRKEFKRKAVDECVVKLQNLEKTYERMKKYYERTGYTQGHGEVV